MFLVRTEKPCSSSRPYNLTSAAAARRVKDARLGTAKRREASLMRLDGGGHAECRRGRFPPAKAVPDVHRKSPSTTGESIRDSNYRFVLQSARAVLLQSARAVCCKVPVDNLLIHKPARQSSRASTLPNHDRRASLDRCGAVRER